MANETAKKNYNWSLIISVVVHIITASIYMGYTIGQFSALQENIIKLEEKIEKQADLGYKESDAVKDLYLRDKRMDLLELRLQTLEKIHLSRP